MCTDNSLYKVWYDPEIDDFIAIESKDITFSLLINLNKINIKTEEVLAKNRNDALGKVFPELKKIEKPIKNKKRSFQHKIKIVI